MIASLVWPFGVILAVIALEALTHRSVYRRLTNRSILVELLCHWQWYRRLHGGSWILLPIGGWVPLNSKDKDDPWWEKTRTRQNGLWEDWP